jgi:hypothetical protein
MISTAAACSITPGKKKAGAQEHATGEEPVRYVKQENGTAEDFRMCKLVSSRFIDYFYIYVEKTQQPHTFPVVYLFP